MELLGVSIQVTVQTPSARHREGGQEIQVYNSLPTLNSAPDSFGADETLRLLFSPFDFAVQAPDSLLSFQIQDSLHVIMCWAPERVRSL